MIANCVVGVGETKDLIKLGMSVESGEQSE